MEGLPGDPVRRRGSRAGGRPEDLLTAPRRLVLLRHGRTGDNASGRIQGQLDTPLDGVGRAQAAAVGPVLASVAPAVVVTSDLVRARHTAEPLAAAAGVDLAVDARLREIHLGRWQGLTAEEARQLYPDEHEAWRTGRDLPRGGGETYAETGARAATCLAEQLSGVAAGGTLIAVTHGGTARAALGVLLDLPREAWPRLAPLGNTCWTVLVEGDVGWRLERHNAGLGPLVGAATGAHDLGSTPVGGVTASPDVEPVG